MSNPTTSSSNNDLNDSTTATTTTTTKCGGCGVEFPSKNAIFKHLKETDGVCLSKEDRQDFIIYLRRNIKLQKTVILYGYLPFNCNDNDDSTGTSSLSSNLNVSNGQDAGRILLETIQEWQDQADGIVVKDDEKNGNKMTTTSASSSYERINRSYGIHGRNSEFLQQDENTGAISEVMAVKLRPLRRDTDVEQWIDTIQDHLEQKYKSFLVANNDGVVTAAPIRILGRLDMPNPKFNAEKDVS